MAGLLALYTELGVTEGIRRTLRHLLDTNLAGARPPTAQWPIELAFLAEARSRSATGTRPPCSRPFLAAYAGMNLVGGQFVAVFGSADRYLAQVAALLGEPDAAERHFATALAMDRRMGSVVHTADTLAAHARAVHDDRPGPRPRARRQGPGAGRADRPRPGAAPARPAAPLHPARRTSPRGRWRCSRCWPGG